MARQARTIEEQAVDVELVRIGKLPHRAQLELHTLLGEHLADLAVGKLSKTDEKVERQQQALAAMKLVAAAQGRAEGLAPVSTDFDAHARRLGLPWTVRSVGLAFSSFSNAARTFESGRAPDSARHTRQREFTGGEHATIVDYLDCIEEWLATKPEEETPASYGRWRQPQVQARKAAGKKAPVTWHQMNRAFPELNPEDVIGFSRRPLAQPRRALPRSC